MTHQESRRHRRDALAAAALIVGLAVLCFLPIALMRGAFYFHDVQYYFYPYHALSGALVQRGELPLWNATAFSGMPLIGDGQTAVFYPPSWLFFLLRPEVALNLGMILQFVIAGLGMYAFLRDLRLHRDAALLGTVSFMFCGFMTARVVHLSIMAGAALLPLIFLSVHRGLRLGQRRWFGFAALAVALQAVCGHPQIPVYTAISLGAFALVLAWGRQRRDGDHRWWWRMPLRLAGIYALGYLVAAVQVVPWMELARQSPRAAGASFDLIFTNSATPYHWLLMLFPHGLGAVAPGLFAERGLKLPLASAMWEHSAYVGLLPLALAALTIWQVLATRRDPQVGAAADRGGLSPDQHLVALFFAGLVPFAMLFSSGEYTPFSHLLYHTPVLGKLRQVERFMAVGDFALAALAALGLQSVATARGDDSEAVRKRLRVLAYVLLALPVALVAMLQIPALKTAVRVDLVEHMQPSRANVWIPLAIAAASACLFFWLRRRPVTTWMRGTIVAVVIVDMGIYAATFNPMTTPDVYRQPPRVLQALPADGPFRKMTFLPFNDIDNTAAKETLAVSWGMAFGVEDANGFNSLQPRRYTDYLFGTQVEDVSYGQLNDVHLLRADSPILSSLNVKYLLVPQALQPLLGPQFHLNYENERVRVYENALAYPRAYFTDAARAATDPGQVLQMVTADGFDGRKQALVEASGISLPTDPPGTPAATIALGRWGASEQRLTATTARPRLLITSEMFYPGWQALIDGQRAPVVRANYLFRAVVIPAGTHEVVFRYRPLSIGLGAVATLIGLLLVGYLIARRPIKPASV